MQTPVKMTLAQYGGRVPLNLAQQQQQTANLTALSHAHGQSHQTRQGVAGALGLNQLIPMAEGGAVKGKIPLKVKKKPPTYLVGEEGPELYEDHDGNAEVIGEHGPEIRQFAKDGDITPAHLTPKRIADLKKQGVKPRMAGGPVMTGSAAPLPALPVKPVSAGWQNIKPRADGGPVEGMVSRRPQWARANAAMRAQSDEDMAFLRGTQPTLTPEEAYGFEPDGSYTRPGRIHGPSMQDQMAARRAWRNETSLPARAVSMGQQGGNQPGFKASPTMTGEDINARIRARSANRAQQQYQAGYDAVNSGPPRYPGEIRRSQDGQFWRFDEKLGHGVPLNAGMSPPSVPQPQPVAVTPPAPPSPTAAKPMASPAQSKLIWGGRHIMPPKMFRKDIPVRGIDASTGKPTEIVTPVILPAPMNFGDGKGYQPGTVARFPDEMPTSGPMGQEYHSDSTALTATNDAPVVNSKATTGPQKFSYSGPWRMGSNPSKLPALNKAAPKPVVDAGAPFTDEEIAAMDPEARARVQKIKDDAARRAAADYNEIAGMENFIDSMRNKVGEDQLDIQEKNKRMQGRSWLAKLFSNTPTLTN